TVTSFSASLLSGLGGDTNKAAKIANKAIIAMSDNANKMGTDIGMIQYAYQGFAKQNFTMLDNLKLGYGGSASEMARLINDSKVLGEGIEITAKTVKDVSFDKYIEAIQVIQDNLGITGTTQKEAEKTISGSLSSMKSAWNNLLPNLINGGDSFDQCVKNLVSSVKIFVGNIKPAIKKALQGVGSLIRELTPIIAKELPAITDDLLPPLIKAATSLVAGIIKALPNIIGALVKELPNIAKTLGAAILDTFGNQFPIAEKIGGLFDRIGNFCKENVGKIKIAIPALIGLASAFKGLKAVKSITSLFGGSGGSRKSSKGGLLGNLTKGLKDLAKTKPAVILKGMWNLAIILGGFTIITAALMAIAPHMAKLSDVQSLTEVIGTMFVLGSVGTALAKFAGIVGKIPIMTVVKGLANMAIMIVGVGVLVSVVGAATLIDFNYARILQLTGLIGALGLVGGVLGIFAGIVGMIPIPVVLNGLANMALVVGGMTALILAFGKLSEVKGFNEFIAKGGETLANLFNQIGKIAGSLIGGLGEGLTDSLPAIGDNLSGFVRSLKPMFNLMKGVDTAGVGSFFGSLGSFILKMTGNDIASFFTGGTDWAQLGTDLTNFATNAKGFFDKVASMPEDGFSKAKLLFQSLSDIGNVPNSGGIAQWFSGKNDFDGLANGLKSLASEGIVSFYKTVSTLPDGCFEKAKQLFASFADIGNIPNTGGVAQWFSGENDITGLGGQLKQFAIDVRGFFSLVNNLNVTNMNALWTALGKVGEISKLDFSGLAGKGTNISTFMTNVKGFFTGASEVVEQAESANTVATALQSFFTIIKGIVVTSLANISSGVSNMVASVSKSTEVFQTMGTAMILAAANSGKIFDAMVRQSASCMLKVVLSVKNGLRGVQAAISQTDLSSAGKNMINGLISGMNSKKSEAVETAKNIAQSISNAINETLKINSPSRVTMETGKFVDEGLIHGMDKLRGKTIDKAKQVAGGLVNVFSVEDTYSPVASDYTPENTVTTNNNRSSTTNKAEFTINLYGASANDSNRRKLKSMIKETWNELMADYSDTNPVIMEV
ncbi:MAG: hypothetical protein ACI4CT_05390, partial [Lachnospiraceae bacterium]